MRSAVIGVAPKSRVNFKLVGPQPVQSAMCTQITRAHNNEIEESFCKRICVEMQCILSIIAKFHINITDYRKHILVYAQ